MAKVKMLNMAGEAVGEIELKDEIFAILNGLMPSP